MGTRKLICPVFSEDTRVIEGVPRCDAQRHFCISISCNAMGPFTTKLCSCDPSRRGTIVVGRLCCGNNDAGHISGRTCCGVLRRLVNSCPVRCVVVSPSTDSVVRAVRGCNRCSIFGTSGSMLGNVRSIAGFLGTNILCFRGDYGYAFRRFRACT